MSTEQLNNPGKVYKVLDELEPCFFVIFYKGVHWIEHNKPPCLDVKFIFDHMQTIVQCNHVGSTGKWDLYAKHNVMMSQELTFTRSQPFTDLIGELYCLFQSLHYVNTAKQGLFSQKKEHISNIKKLKDCKEII